MVQVPRIGDVDLAAADDGVFDDPGLLTVTRTRAAANVSSFTTFPIEAIIDGTTGPIENQDYGQMVMSGQVGVATSGAVFTSASPTFLSAPEPAAFTTAAGALSALAAVARRRRV